MVTIRSINEIIQSLRDFYKLTQPDMDTKPGTIARDVFIDAPASQLALLYDQVSDVSTKQSLRLVIGSDLDKLAKNFGVPRRQATPAGGTALLTFASINAPININKGDTVIASNGFSYSVISGASITPTSINFYRSIANKFRDQLDIAGISDQYAVEISVLSSSSGSAGNIAKYSLNRTTIPGVSNVTNVRSFSGGTDQESDASFRGRVLASFSGSSVGTVLGYQNVALGTSGVSDAIVVEPGDALMIRDGSKVRDNPDGTKTILSEGSGGKVDIIILGSNLVKTSDSFIYRDKSNTNDPTNSKNNVVLGQILGDENKTINRRRIENLANGQLPLQPIDSVSEIIGSISGSNFKPKSIDSLGRVSGNYELVKDTGIFGGSCFGFDTLKFISDRISLFNEDKIKGQYNGQDAVTFTGVTEISDIQQNIFLTNENSTVTSDRSIIQLLHTPVVNVTKVYNVNTGERYIVVNQNIDSYIGVNTSGRIKISGNTLPSPSDILQVDYSWIVNYDAYSDYDGLKNTTNERLVTDSIDWGYSSIIKNENVKFDLVTGNNFFLGTTSHPISTVLNVKKFTEVDGVVVKLTSGTFVNRLAVLVTNLSTTSLSVDSVTLKNSNTEVYNTAQLNGSFSNTSSVFGITIVYNTTIILPTDTSAEENDFVTVFLNSIDVFSVNSTTGNSNGSQITIPSDQVDTAATSITLKATYISNVQELFSSAITSLSANRLGNGFILNSSSNISNFSQTNNYKRENQIVKTDLSNNLYVDLNSNRTEYNVTANNILSVIRLTDNLEIWNNNHIGTVTTGTNGNYKVIFTGYNTPITGDRVLVIYSPIDTKRFQPFSYSNNVIKTSIQTLSLDIASDKLFVKINNLTTQIGVLSFTVIEPNTDIILFSSTDGYLTASTDGSSASLVSELTDFTNVLNITSKKVKISTATNSNNNGTYDISGYDVNTNTLTITNTLSNISKDQVSIIKISDSQEIWNYNGTINTSSNKLIIGTTTVASVGDKVFVMIYKYSNLRKAPSCVISTISDQSINSGTITVSGITLNKAKDIVFTCTNTNLKLNLNEAIRKALNLLSTATIPSTVKLARIVKLERVITASIGSDEVINVLNEYYVKGAFLNNNLYYSDELNENSTLQNLEVILPNSSNNINTEFSKNLPTIGDKLRVTFYYTIDNDSENLSYTRNGTLYTNKKFALINKIFVSSGFKNSQSTRITCNSFTQPNLGSRYKVFYDYLAPKQNERIVVNYNYNKLISDVTLNVENTRPINADVLVRSAKSVLLDVTVNVVISDDYKNSSNTVLQNLKDKIISTLTSSKLNTIVDVPTIINAAQSVKGVARARIIYFNKTGQLGSILIVQAQKDEYFTANNVIINTETR